MATRKTRPTVFDGESMSIFNGNNTNEVAVWLDGDTLRFTLGGVGGTDIFSVSTSGGDAIVSDGDLVFQRGAASIRAGGTLSIGESGDIINLNVSGATYYLDSVVGSPNVRVTGKLGINSAQVPITDIQIGDISPTVYSGWSGALRRGILIGQDTDNMYIGMYNTGADADFASIVWGDNGTEPLLFMTNDSDGVITERIRISGNGNVGIGRAASSYALEVNGSILATSWIRTSGATGWFSESYSGGWYMTDSNYLRNYNSKPLWMKGTVNANTNYVGLTIENNTSGDIDTSTETSIDFIHTDVNTTSISYPRARISVKQGTDGTTYFEEGGDLLFYTALGSGTNVGTLNERMRITDLGNVGIGTDNPSEKLHVVGDILIEGNGASMGLTNVDNGFIRLGAVGSTVKMGIDTNEVLVAGDNLNIGVTSSGNSVRFINAGVIKGYFDSAGLFIGAGTEQDSTSIAQFSTRVDLGTGLSTNSGQGRVNVVPTEYAILQHIKNYIHNYINYAGLSGKGLVGTGSDQLAQGNHTHGAAGEVGVGSMYKFVNNTVRKSLDLVYIG